MCCARVACRGRGRLTRRHDAAAAPPATARASAPIDLTGYWVAFVNEDWRYRMVTPPKGDYRGVPMTPEGTRIANTWNPAADRKPAAVQVVRRSGDHAGSRPPSRHVAGRQHAAARYRRRHADAAVPIRPAALRRRARRHGRDVDRAVGTAGAATPERARGSLTVVTTNMRAGYLRKNGVPYSENATRHRIFRRRPAPLRRTVADRHDRRRRSAVPAAAVYRQLALQERNGWLQMGSEPVHGNMVRSARRRAIVLRCSSPATPASRAGRPRRIVGRHRQRGPRGDSYRWTTPASR